MAELKITLFGGVEITQAGKAVDGFVSQKALALFCYLAVTSRSHPRALLQGLLWGESSQADAMNSLRNVLSNLRKLMGDHLLISRQSVAFNREAAYWLDVEQFFTAVLNKQHPHGRLSPPDLHALETAVSLYTGELMAGFSLADAPAFEEWLLAQRERLHLLTLQTLHRLVAHYIITGQHEQAVAMNGRLLSVEPWREESYRQQMLMLARAGQLNEALAQYQHCRDVLLRDLGLAPAPETRELYERIRAARDLPRHNLPAPRDALIGRQKEMADLTTTLRDPDCRLLTLTGPGGVGKTRLAQEITVVMAADFLNGARYVSLASVPHPDYLITAVAATLNLSLTPQPSPAEQLSQHLRRQEQLLVLDNFDQMLPVADWLDEVLAVSPSLKILITSRERLNLQQEWLYPLSGLPYPDDQAAPPPSPTPAETLFYQRTRHVRHDFNPEQEQTAVAHICRLLAGFPLGIILAAAQVAHLTCPQIAEMLAQNVDALAVSWPNMPARHRSLRAIFDHSWQQLTPQEQGVFRRLSLFRGGFTLASGATIADLTPTILAALHAKSFLWASSDHRYDTHEILRQFAAELLAANPQEQAETQAAYVGYFAELLAEQEDRFILSLPDVLARLQPEVDNVRLAWETAVTHTNWPQIRAMMGTLHRFYEALTWYQEGYDQFQLAYQALLPKAASHPRSWGRLLAHLSGLSLRLGRINEGKELAEKSIQWLQTASDPAGLALALNSLGILQIHSGDYGQAEASLQHAIDLYQRLGNRIEIVRPLANLGSAYSRQGKYDDGLAALQKGLAACRDIGDRRGEALFLNNIAANHLMRGEREKARPFLEACLPVCDEIQFDQVKQVALYNLGEIYLHQAQYESAITVCQAAADIARRLQDRMSLARALKIVGVAQIRQGDFVSAWRSLQEGLAAAETTAALPAIFDVLDGMADYYLAVSRQAEAIELWQVIATHPAAEAQYRDRARQQLTNHGRHSNCGHHLNCVPGFLETNEATTSDLLALVHQILYSKRS